MAHKSNPKELLKIRNLQSALREKSDKFKEPKWPLIKKKKSEARAKGGRIGKQFGGGLPIQPTAGANLQPTVGANPMGVADPNRRFGMKHGSKSKGGRTGLKHGGSAGVVMS